MFELYICPRADNCSYVICRHHEPHEQHGHIEGFCIRKSSTIKCVLYKPIEFNLKLVINND